MHWVWKAALDVCLLRKVGPLPPQDGDPRGGEDQAHVRHVQEQDGLRFWSILSIWILNAPSATTLPSLTETKQTSMSNMNWEREGMNMIKFPVNL